jgi:hypothetical protein
MESLLEAWSSTGRSRRIHHACFHERAYGPCPRPRP